jgi:hypothetical protein
LKLRVPSFFAGDLLFDGGYLSQSFSVSRLPRGVAWRGKARRSEANGDCGQLKRARTFSDGSTSKENFCCLRSCKREKRKLSARDRGNNSRCNVHRCLGTALEPRHMHWRHKVSARNGPGRVSKLTYPECDLHVGRDLVQQKCCVKSRGNGRKRVGCSLAAVRGLKAVWWMEAEGSWRRLVRRGWRAESW